MSPPRRPSRADPPARTARAAAAVQAERACAGRRQPVQRRGQERADRILEAAAALVDEVGPAAVTTTMVASRAGTSVGSVYAYFRDRTAIYDAIVTRCIDKQVRLSDEVRDAAPELDFFDQADRVIDRSVALYRTEPAYRALWFSSHLSATMVAAMQRSDEQLAHHLLERLRASGDDLDTDDPVAAMRLYVGIVDKGMQLAFALDPQGDAAIIAETRRALRRYLQPCLVRSGRRNGSPPKARR
jgi:AcrR family transcriptional regulator